MKKSTGISNLSNLTKLGLNWAKPSANELARRHNNRLRAAAQRQSAVRAAAKRNKTPSPPKRKNSPKRKTPSPPKRKTPSPRVTIGARVPIASRVVTLPNGTKQTQYFITNEYYPVGPNGRYNFTKPVKR